MLLLLLLLLLLLALLLANPSPIVEPEGIKLPNPMGVLPTTPDAPAAAATAAAALVPANVSRHTMMYTYTRESRGGRWSDHDLTAIWSRVIMQYCLRYFANCTCYFTCPTYHTWLRLTQVQPVNAAGKPPLSQKAPTAQRVKRGNCIHCFDISVPAEYCYVRRLSSAVDLTFFMYILMIFLEAIYKLTSTHQDENNILRI